MLPSEFKVGARVRVKDGHGYQTTTGSLADQEAIIEGVAPKGMRGSVLVRFPDHWSVVLSQGLGFYAYELERIDPGPGIQPPDEPLPQWLQ